MKRVFLVHDTLLDRDVAFALMKLDALGEHVDRQRVLLEAQTMARLGEHPNIVAIYEFGEESGQPFMVLPVLAGGTVADLIKKADAGRLELDVSLRIAADICKGLEFAHSNGVVHRDLKPSNVWLTGDGVAKIGDFGIALSPAHTRLTQSGVVLGTVAYISPEQALGEDVDCRSDLYSFGAMLYELVTGGAPFVGGHPVAVIGQHINNSPVPPSSHNPHCPPRLETMILDLLAKDPAERPDSSATVLDRLAAVNQAVEREQPSPAVEQASGRPLRVLLVEDAEDDAELLLRELRKGGYSPTSARVDTPAAMKAALEEGTWDVVVSDYSMPHFSAPAAQKLLLNSGLDLPFIIVSGTISDEAAVDAMKSGAHDYLRKDNLARLVPAIERELHEAQERRGRRRAEHEERRLHAELQERFADLTEQNRLLQVQRDRQGGPGPPPSS